MDRETHARADNTAECFQREVDTRKKPTGSKTYFVMADADNIKGIEFDDNGNDKSPKGVDPFTDPDHLFALYPNPKRDKAYAVYPKRIIYVRRENHHTVVSDSSFCSIRL